MKQSMKKAALVLMLALAVLLFFPALGAGSLFGQPVVGLVAPAGISVVFGAFIFGIGMQLGGGCACRAWGWGRFMGRCSSRARLQACPVHVMHSGAGCAGPAP